MEDFYCYGDVHQHVKSAQDFLDAEKPKKVIWLGDFFDTHSDNAQSAGDTVRWLKHTVESRPNDVFILGNHDISYRFPTDAYVGYGWNEKTQFEVNNHFPKDLWNRFVFHHKERYNEQDVFFSHGGISGKHHPAGKFDENYLNSILSQSLNRPRNNYHHPIVEDFDCGILWQRWYNMDIVKGLCQVVGHTPCGGPLVQKNYLRSPEWNLNLDCTHTYYAKFTEHGVYAVNRHTGSQKRLKLEVLES